MDLSLWDPPICEDESCEFGGNFAENWLRSDFCYGYGLYDVIEEDALNENACMEVLKIMLSKAKNDIGEVEEEVTILRRQLAWADEVWSKKHSILKERIQSLDVLILGLMNEEHRTENALDFQNFGEHAEKLGVIVRDLLESYSPNTDSQNSGLVTDKPTPYQSEEETKKNNFMAISCEEIVEPLCTENKKTDVREEDKASEETLQDVVHNRGEKALRVKQRQNTGVVGKAPHKSNLSLKSGVHSLTEKKFPIGSLVSPEPSLAMGMEHVIPLLKNLKRRIPSGQVGKNSGYKKNTDKEVDVNKGGKSNSAATDVNLDPVSQPSVKRKKCQSSPSLKKNEETINQGNAKMDEDMRSQLIEDEDDNISSTASALIELSSSKMSFSALTLVELRAMAKERKLKGYSKSKKSVLIKLLQDQ